MTIIYWRDHAPDLWEWLDTHGVHSLDEADCYQVISVQKCISEERFFLTCRAKPENFRVIVDGEPDTYGYVEWLDNFEWIALNNIAIFVQITNTTWSQWKIGDTKIDGGCHWRRSHDRTWRVVSEEALRNQRKYRTIV